VWTVTIARGGVEIEAGEPRSADCALSTDPQTLVSLLEGGAFLRALRPATAPSGA
jgi:hypothetical protein